MGVATSMALMGYPEQEIARVSSTSAALKDADWKLRYALDRLDGTEHPGLRHTMIAARTQITAAMKLTEER